VSLRVTVVGAGPGGLAVAGNAALRGHDVTLCDRDLERVEAVGGRGGIEVEGAIEGFASVTRTVDDPADAVAEADIVFIVTQGQDQGEAAAAMADALPRDAVVVVLPGCTGGALEVANRLGGGRACVAEGDAFPFGCSIPRPGVSRIASMKRTFSAATIPAGDERAPARLREVFPEVSPAPTVLATSLANMNMVLHVAPMICNAGRIEFSGGGFDFYGNGVTPSVARVMAGMDAERAEVARALETPTPTLLEWMSTTYGVTAASLYDGVRALHHDVYGAMPAPRNLRHRYLLEDVACGAVPIAQLGRLCGLEMRVTCDLIELASALTGIDFWATGRTLARLGLEGESPAGVRRRLSAPARSG
jgi:opine dehydrogenase